MRATVLYAFWCLLVLTSACTSKPPKTAPEPENVFQNLSLTESRLGTASWSLKSEEARMIHKESSILLKKPFVEIYEEGKLTAKVNALEGALRTDTQDIHFSRSVLVTSLKDSSTLSTEKLRYVAGRKRLYSDEAVVLSRNGSKVEGQGLEASPDLSEIIIKKQKTTLSK